MQVLRDLTSDQRTEYPQVVEAVLKKIGHHLLAEVYRAILKVRVRAKGKILTQPANDVEHWSAAYTLPTAPEYMVRVLASDYLDTQQNRDLQLYVKQVRPGDLQEAVARALELEAFLVTLMDGGATEDP